MKKVLVAKSRRTGYIKEKPAHELADEAITTHPPPIATSYI